MKLLYFLLFILLLFSSVLGAPPRDTCDCDTSAYIHITSLPYTASTPDTCYLIDSSLHATGAALISSYDDVLIQSFNNDTLYWGESNGGSIIGFNPSGSDRSTYKGFTLYHNPSDSTVNDITGLYMATGSYTTFENLRIRVTGYNAKAVRDYSTYAQVDSTNFNHCAFWSDGVAYTSRCSYDGAVVQVGNNVGTEAGVGYVGDPYSYRFYKCSVLTGPGQGFVSNGRPYDPPTMVCWFDSCYSKTDVINIFYTWGDADESVCHANDNGYTYLLRNLGPGSRFVGNKGFSGTNRGGSRGLMIENCQGSEDSLIEVTHNYFDNHEGFSTHYGWNKSFYVVRIREIDGYHLDYISVHNNVFVGTGHNDTTSDSTTSYTPGAVAVSLNYGPLMDSMLFYNNVCSAKVFDGQFNEMFSKRPTAFQFDYCSDSLWTVYGNYYYSQNIVMKYGGPNELASDMVSQYDTLDGGNGTYSYSFMFSSDNTADNSDGNKLRDATFLGGVDPLDTTSFVDGLPSGGSDLTIEATLGLTVKDSIGTPISNAICSVLNNYDKLVMVDTTNSSGQVSKVLNIAYWDRVAQDSVEYNPYTIKVWYSGDSIYVDSTLETKGSNFIITLGDVDVTTRIKLRGGKFRNIKGR